MGATSGGIFQGLWVPLGTWGPGVRVSGSLGASGPPGIGPDSQLTQGPHGPYHLLHCPAMTTTKQPDQTKPEDLVGMNVSIPTDLHKRVRVKCIKEDVRLSEAVTQALRGWVRA